MIFELKYYLVIKQYKNSYRKPGLVGYISSNYASNIKTRQLIIDYVYLFYRAAVF